MGKGSKWSRCRVCNATLVRERVDGVLPSREEHINAFATGLCKSKVFEQIPYPGAEGAAAAEAELKRRAELFAGRPKTKSKLPLTSSPGGRSSRWDGVAATRARPTSASVGQPGSGKRR